MSKKVLVGLLLGSILMTSALGVAAQSPIPDQCLIREDTGISSCPGKGSPCVYETNKLCGLCCLLSTIFYAANWIFTIMIVLVILFVLWGAFEILQAAGDAERVNSGRDRITYAAIGLGIALMARAVPAIVRYVVGVD